MPKLRVLLFAACWEFGGVAVAAMPQTATNLSACLRGIRPAFDAACLNCHGPDSPQGRLRLDSGWTVWRDGRWVLEPPPPEPEVSELKRTEVRALSRLANARSPVAPSPPVPKPADASPVEEILVEEIPPPPREEYEIVTGFGWTGVSGNRAQFREHYWQPEGWNGGLERYTYTERLGTNRVFQATARALRDDYRLTLSLENTNLGFARLNWEQYGKYYNTVGGYYPAATPPVAHLPFAPRLDLGRAGAEFGLTLPSWPKIVLGYEYRYRDGDKALTQWLPTTREPYLNILPNAKAIEESLHVLRLDLSHDVAGFNLADNFRYEFYDLGTSRGGAPADEVPGPLVITKESHDSKQWANAFSVERPLREWWLVTAGYLHTHASGEASFNQATFDATGQPTAGYFWNAPAIVFESHSETLNFNTQLGPWQGLSGSAGLQTEWAWQSGFGNVAFDTDIAGPPRPGLVDANHHRVTIEESLGLRYTQIPYTTLFADAKLRQEQISQFQEQLGDSVYALASDADITGGWTDLRAGLRTSPWARLWMSAHYRYLDRETDYDYPLDVLFDSLGQPLPGDGYPAFITWRETRTDEVQARLGWRPRPWLRTLLSGRWLQTDYRTRTMAATERFPWGGSIETSPGGQLQSGTYDAQVYSVGAILTPWRRLQLSTTFAFTDTRTVTAVEDPHAVVPYEGAIYSVLCGATWRLSERTDLNLFYAYSAADYGQEDTAVGLPLGVTYGRQAVNIGLTHRFGPRFAGNVRYGFYSYDEPTSGNFNDYTAHSLFASLLIKTP
jgi:hypothetical protein